MKNWWRKLTYEIPLQFSDALWDVMVVQLAAWLDRLTLRRIIALIPILILILAYAHSIPIPPELMLVGDVLAYIDIFSVILLLGIMSRAATIFFVVKQAVERAMEFARCMRTAVSRLDFRHRRESSTSGRKRASSTAKRDEDDYAVIRGLVSLAA